MKALVFTDIREMTYRDVPDPQLESDEVLIRVRAAGFCGSELESFVGKSRRRKPPLIMGHEFSGEIAAAGDDVTDVSIGQRAAVNPLIPCGNCHYCGRGLTNACPNRLLHSLHLPGAFAEYIAVKRSSVFPVAESLPYQHAAMAEPLANGLHVNSLISDCSPEDVVVFGAGVIGLMCLQAAMLAGATRDDRRQIVGPADWKSPDASVPTKRSTLATGMPSPVCWNWVDQTLRSMPSALPSPASRLWRSPILEAPSSTSAPPTHSVRSTVTRSS